MAADSTTSTPRSGPAAAGAEPMIEFTDGASLRAWVAAHRRAGRRIGFVPTMGALHQGHLSLVDAARGAADVVLLSVFVNPLQFGPGEDYERYPRDLARDRALAAARGVNAIFAPPVELMYPPGAETRVQPGPTAARWEGAERPGHFLGVLTVVATLFNLVQPDVAVFGQKDIQQAILIRRMVADLAFPIEILVAPIVRESDGLALSSRNAYLSGPDREQAVGLSRGLAALDRAWRAGERSAAALEAALRQELGRFPGVSLDYIAVADPEGLEPVTTADRGTIVAVAGRVGGTRLLDNHILGTEFR